jgi:malonyl CoA-acyl carrier protein transacylase
MARPGLLPDLQNDEYWPSGSCFSTQTARSESPLVWGVTRAAHTALLFPGQGSHEDGMRDAVARARPDLLELAETIVGDDLFARAGEATRFAQPAIFCASVASLTAAPWELAGWMAGHSLGEFAALVAAGSLAAEDGLRLVALRGQLMDDAAGGAGGMVALLGGDAAELASDIAVASGAWVANLNAPAQVVLAGEEDAVAAAARIARDRGLRTLVLPVRGAFHTPLMESARAPFEAALAEVRFRPTRVPVVSGVTAEPFDDIRLRLAEALTEPVRWHEVLEALANHDVRCFVEAAPGRTLTKLVRRTLADVEAGPIAEAAGV